MVFKANFLNFHFRQGILQTSTFNWLVKTTLQLFISMFIVLNYPNGFLASYHSHIYQDRESLAADTQCGVIHLLFILQSPPKKRNTSLERAFKTAL